MPELPEVEAYRRLAERALGRPVRDATVHDPRFVRGTTSARAVVSRLRGATFSAARRHGKLLVLDVEAPSRPGHRLPAGAAGGDAAGARLGLRFGMTGSLVVDGSAGVDRLLYASDRGDAAWDRFSVRFADGGRLVVHDPRLLGGVELDPDESLLGPDAASVSPAQLRHALEHSAVAVKARLMDQRRLAGVGNLMADEILWRAGIAPQRRAASLSPAEHRRLHRHLRATIDLLLERGGSHLGDLVPQRHPGGRCPRDGAELSRSTVGGRTSWWCGRHQR